MKLLILFLCVSAALAYKEAMLSSNRVQPLKNSCDQCQSFVHKFHDAIKDPNKLAELKALLRVLCHETHYVDECRVMVNNLDQIIDKLEPYLEDAKAVCTKIHMCSNKKLEVFHKLGVFFASRRRDSENGYAELVCDECQFAAHELKMIIEDKKWQDDLRNFLRTQVCAKFRSYRGACDLVVEQFLPELFQELDALLKNPKQLCQQAGFCPRTFFTPKLNGVAGFLAEI